MASKKKAPEGIALLSMYNDEDDEMDDTADDEEAEDVEFNIASTREDDFYHTEFSAPADWVQENTPQVANEVPTPNSSKHEIRLTPQQSQPPQLSPLFAELQPEPKRGKGKLAIVDYGHDEVALSPDAEEREVAGIKLIMADGELQNVNGHSHERILESIGAIPPGITQSVEQLDFSHHVAIELQDMLVDEDAQTSVAPAEDVVLLDRFLPLPLEAKCSAELQEKINKFLAYKKHGKSFNAEVRNRKDYRNPDFLLHAVRYQDIDQIGSCFSKDVFDPHGYDKSDYYDEIEAGVARQLEKREQERKKSQKVDFVSGGSQPGSATKTTMLVPGGIPNASSGLLSNPSPSESRHNKKSKWDKVEGERGNPVGGQESASAVGAHTAILSAANAGAGYTAFAQQRRREAEEKRSSKWKSERSL